MFKSSNFFNLSALIVVAITLAVGCSRDHNDKKKISGTIPLPTSQPGPSSNPTMQTPTSPTQPGVQSQSQTSSQNQSPPSGGINSDPRNSTVRDEKFAEQCVNNIKIEVESGETEISLAEIVTGEEGSYNLVQAELFYQDQDLQGIIESIHGRTVGFVNPPVVGSEHVRIADGAEVLCHTSEKIASYTVDQKTVGNETTTDTQSINHKSSIRSNMDFPNSFSTKDGSVTKYKEIKFEAKDGISTAKASIYNRIEKIEENFNDATLDVPGLTYLFTVNNDTKDLVLRMRYEVVDADDTQTFFVVATYSLDR